MTTIQQKIKTLVSWSGCLSGRATTNVLLFGVFVVLILIWRRMPPNIGDMRHASDGGDAAWESFTERLPLVRVHGSVNVEQD